jgi:hypothetical protein
MVNEVTVGDDEPSECVEHYPRAESANFVPSRQRDALAGPPTLRGGHRGDACPTFYVDHRGRNPLHHRGEAGHAGVFGDDGQRDARMGNRACAEPKAERDRCTDLPYFPHGDR